MFLASIALVSIIIGLIYLSLIWSFNYWKKRGVNGPKPHLLFGNYPSIFTQKRNMVYDLDDVYRSYKKDEDFVGIYSLRTPQLLVTSPEMARRILVTNFKHFHDNEISTFVTEKSDFIFANNPFSLTGDHWKERRAEITPALVASRIKNVYPVTNKICKKLIDYIKAQTRVAPKEGVDAKELALRFTTEVVTDCVLGLNADSLTEKPTPIMGMIQNLFKQTFSIIFYISMTSIFPGLKRFYKIKFIPLSVEKFFVDLMQNAINIRKSKENQHERIDFLNYILQLQEKKQLTTLQMTAHSMTFLLDGFETTAAVISHCLLLLARYPATQQKLYEEIIVNSDKSDGISFDALHELPYLDACVHEAIRIFTPGFVSNKICTEPIELTSKSGVSITVPKGLTVVLPFYSIMVDEDYYPEPQEFQPERFLPENGCVKKYRDMGVYYGFGDGPRTCLGMRFALTQTKAAIVEVLRNFTVTVNTKTKNGNNFDPNNFIAELEGGVWLNFESRS